MTPDEGYKRAKHQTPGHYISMGPALATIKQVQPVSDFHTAKLVKEKGSKSWGFGHDVGYSSKMRLKIAIQSMTKAPPPKRMQVQARVSSLIWC